MAEDGTSAERVCEIDVRYPMLHSILSSVFNFRSIVRRRHHRSFTSLDSAASSSLCYLDRGIASGLWSYLHRFAAVTARTTLYYIVSVYTTRQTIYQVYHAGHHLCKCHIQSLSNILQQVLGILNAYTQPHQARINTQFQSLCFRDRTVRHHPRRLGEGFDATQRFGE